SNETATHGPVPSSSRLGAELDLDVDAGGEVELHQRVHGLRSRVDDVEHALVGADLELLARLLVDVRRAVDRELLDAGRQRDRPAHLRAGPLGRAHDLAGRGIEHAMIEGFQPDSDICAVHGLARSALLRLLVVTCGCYLAILVTTPAPTVRPPSRIANRRPSSIAIGWISSTTIRALSPRIPISVPSGNVTPPVTSVVRK